MQQTMEMALLEAKVSPEVACEFRHIILPFALKPNQIQGLQAILYWSRCGNYDSPRTGKTITMLLTAIYFARYGYKSVFIMPPILFDQFEEELNKIARHGVRQQVLNQSPAKRAAILEKIQSGSLAVDILSMSKEIFKLHVDDLILAGYKVLYFDECHKGLMSCDLKTKTKQHTCYGAVRRFLEYAKDARLILATGTPIPRELDKAYPMISLKTPGAYRDKREFDFLHVTWRPMVVHGVHGDRTINVPDMNNYLQVEVLQRHILAQSVRANQMEVLGLETPNFQVVPVRLATAHANLYRQVVKEKLLEVGGEMIDARNESKMRVLAQQLITSPKGFTPYKFENMVITMVRTLLDTIDYPNNKVVLFANYNASVETLVKEFQKDRPAVVFGPNGSDLNRKEVARFKEDPRCAMLVANPDAGGVGITLGHVCQTAIFVEPVTTPGQLEQAASRIILQGQTSPVVVYILNVLGTGYAKAIDVMLGRADQAKSVLMDKRTLLDELLGKR